MFENLKTAKEHASNALAAESEIARHIQSAATDRESLRQKLTELQAAVDSAEGAHADSIAGQSLGEDADLDSTAMELGKARKALADAESEIRQSLRVADSLIEKLSARLSTAQAHNLEAQSAVKSARVEYLRLQTEELVKTSARLVDELAAANIQLSALGGLLADYGSPYQGTGATLDRVVHPDVIRVLEARRLLMAELAA